MYGFSVYVLFFLRPRWAVTCVNTVLFQFCFGLLDTRLLRRYEVCRPLGCDAMKMEATCSSDTSVNLHHTTRCRSPDNTDSWLRLGSMTTREMISVIWIKISMPNLWVIWSETHRYSSFSEAKWQADCDCLKTAMYSVSFDILIPADKFQTSLQ
jgi:hypothetical protein